MAIQTRLPLPVPTAVEINDTVSFLDDGNNVAYFAAGVPLFTHSHGDLVGQRVAMTQILALELAGPKELSAALGLGRTTLWRQQVRFEAQGVAGLAGEKHGPKGPHKLKGELLSRAQGLLDEGKSNYEVARLTGGDRGGHSPWQTHGGVARGAREGFPGEGTR